MKSKISLPILFVFLCLCFQDILANTVTGKSTNTFTVGTTANLNDLTAKWIAEYQKLHPDPMINLVVLTGKNDNVAITKSGADLTFLTDEYNSARREDLPWKLVVGRDAVVLVISKKNPLLSEINLTGITPQRLALLLKDPARQQWGTLLGNDDAAPVHPYLVNEESLRQRVAAFVNTDTGSMNATLLSGGAELAATITKDPNAIGFCRLNDVIDIKRQGFTTGIGLLPIDKNGNGKIDPFENIYGSLGDFLHGVWVGKYPAVLTRNIYCVASSEPGNENQVAFLKWVLDDGQQYLNPNGFFDLSSSERIAKSDLLDKRIMLAGTPESSHTIQTLIILLIFIILAGLTISWGLSFRRNRKTVKVNGAEYGIFSFDESVVKVPKGLWFDRSHTWAFMEQDGMVRIGIDDFLQHLTGPVTRVKMKNPGERVQKGDVILTLIQKGKQLNICSPVSGTIQSQNGLLHTDSTALNTAPFTEGWVYTIEPSNWLRETQFLFMAEKYRDWLKNEFIRVKDFFASTSIIPGYALSVLQDGGKLKDNILEGYGPEVWEDFQVKFIDSSK